MKTVKRVDNNNDNTFILYCAFQVLKDTSYHFNLNDRFHVVTILHIHRI